MVEQEENSQQPLQTEPPENVTADADTTTKPYSAGKQALFVGLIALGVIIALPFLLFVACLVVISTGL